MEFKKPTYGDQYFQDKCGDSNRKCICLFSCFVHNGPLIHRQLEDTYGHFAINAMNWYNSIKIDLNFFFFYAFT